MAALFPILLLVFLSASASAHNITLILDAYPEFSTFNRYLSDTHLAEDINSREAVTVVVVDNQTIVGVLSNGPPISTIKRVLSLHVLTDYYGEDKLKQLPNGTVTVSTIFQESGDAPGTSGFVNITNLPEGSVGFKPDGAVAFESFFQKSVKEMPYNISVVQVSTLLRSPEAEASLPSPGSYNLTHLMEKSGCGAFSRLVAANPNVEDEYQAGLNENGLTLFCPVDKAVNSFHAKLKNLTDADRVALLLYHGLPTYFSMAMIRTTTGEVVTTLASENTTTRSGYNFTFEASGELGATINTRIVKAKVAGIIVDQQPLAMYTIDKVLRPNELFTEPEVEAPPSAAPTAPGSEAEPPTGGGDEGDGSDGGRVYVKGWLTAVIAGSVAAGVI